MSSDASDAQAAAFDAPDDLGDGGAPSAAEEGTFVGRRVRELRLAHGLSARVLAERAGVTAAYISRLEAGTISPTIGTLWRVMDALREPLWRVFAHQGAIGPVVRAEERKVMQNEGFVDRLVTPTREGRLEILETIIEPGADSGGQYTHWGEEESVFIIEGELHFRLRDEEFDLRVGDSITFSCRVGHGFRNDTDEPVRVVWVITPGGAAGLEP